jgi:hypothetical protein
MMPTKERYLVTDEFDATRVGELDQCLSISDAETNDETIKRGSYVFAYPEKDGYIKFTTPSALSTFCVKSNIFVDCTKRDFLKREAV